MSSTIWTRKRASCSRRRRAFLIATSSIASANGWNASSATPKTSIEAGLTRPVPTKALREDGDHGSVVARADLTLHDTRRRSIGERLRGKHVVESPADVPLFHVP